MAADTRFGAEYTIAELECKLAHGWGNLTREAFTWAAEQRRENAASDDLARESRNTKMPTQCPTTNQRRPLWNVTRHGG